MDISLLALITLFVSFLNKKLKYQKMKYVIFLYEIYLHNYFCNRIKRVKIKNLILIQFDSQYDKTCSDMQ